MDIFGIFLEHSLSAAQPLNVSRAALEENHSIALWHSGKRAQVRRTVDRQKEGQNENKDERKMHGSYNQSRWWKQTRKDDNRGDDGCYERSLKSHQHIKRVLPRQLALIFTHACFPTLSFTPTSTSKFHRQCRLHSLRVRSLLEDRLLPINPSRYRRLRMG